MNTGRVTGGQCIVSSHLILPGCNRSGSTSNGGQDGIGRRKLANTRLEYFGAGTTSQCKLKGTVKDAVEDLRAFRWSGKSLAEPMDNLHSNIWMNMPPGFGKDAERGGGRN